MNRAVFKEKIQTYCREVGQSQKALAYALNLHYSVLSNKLNGTRNATLTLNEIKNLIRTLVEWQAIHTRNEVAEMLDCLDLKSSYFTSQEWATAPLNRLEQFEPALVKAGNSTPNYPKSSLTVLSQEQLIPEIVPSSPLEPEVVTVSHNLLAQLTPLIGRDSEMEVLVSLFQRADVRLVTLTGPGGVGKTRLALGAVAGLVERFNEGVWFISLASVADSVLVPSAIAHTLGIKENVKQNLLENLKQYLHHKNLLLILDNFEQITSAATVIDELLRHAPNIKILVTSRTILHLYGEFEFIVSPLSLPAPLNPVQVSAETISSLLSSSEAVALFSQRAKAVCYDFKLDKNNVTTVVEICRYLDGLPLAIELAAARLKLFTVNQLLQNLTTSGSSRNNKPLRLEILAGNSTNLPLRQRTIRNTLDWSYQLLRPHEQHLARQIAVFAGSFTLEAVAKVCLDEEISDYEVMEKLAVLLDQSLLIKRQIHGETRFTLLAVVREYLWEKLVEAQELFNREEKQIKYFITMIETAAPQLDSMRNLDTFYQIENNLENYNAIINWLINQNDWETFGRLVLSLWYFWQAGSFLNEAKTWLDMLLPHRESLSSRMLAQLLRLRGNIYWVQGDFIKSQIIDEESLAIWRELDEKLEIAKTLGNMGMNLHIQGQDTQAIELYQESLQIYRELGKGSQSTATLNSLGVAMLSMGELETARNYFNQSLEIHQQLEDKVSIAGAFINLGNIELQKSCLQTAECLYQKSLALFSETKSKRGIAMALRNLAYVKLQLHDKAQARKLYLESLSLRWEISDKIGTASCLEGLASIALIENKFELSVELYSVATNLREQLNAPLTTFDRNYRDTNLMKLKAKLGDSTFNLIWENNKNSSLETVVSSQLQTPSAFR